MRCIAGHEGYSVMWQMFKHFARFTVFFVPVSVMAIGTQCMGEEVDTYANVRSDKPVTKTGPDNRGPHQRSYSPSADQSEDLISGLRSMRYSRGSSYGRVPPGAGRSAETGNVLRSVTRTRKNFNRSMRSITNSVRDMNTSINRIRTYRRRFR